MVYCLLCATTRTKYCTVVCCDVSSSSSICSFFMMLCYLQYSACARRACDKFPFHPMRLPSHTKKKARNARSATRSRDRKPSWAADQSSNNKKAGDGDY
jgi:hypothetical protein